MESASPLTSEVSLAPSAKSKKAAKGSWSSPQRKALEAADSAARKALDAGDITTVAVEKVLCAMGGAWPTQARLRVVIPGHACTLGGIGPKLPTAESLESLRAYMTHAHHKTYLNHNAGA